MPYNDKERQRKAQREWAAKNRARTNEEKRQQKRALVAERKDVPCTDCGGRFPTVCMDFDHRPGEVKVAKVADFVSSNFGLKKMLAEIAKCDVVCANCHRIRTHDRKQYRVAA